MFNVTKIGICLGSLAFVGAAYGSISFNIAAGTLRDKDGLAIDSGLVILALDADRDGFALPDAANFLQGDDLEVARWDFSEGGGIDGEFLAAKVIAAYDSNWAEGDPLALFWYPDLTKASTAPGANANFGVFADPRNVSTGDVWTMPADNTHLYSLQFFAEGSILNQTSFASQYVGSATLDENASVGLSDVMTDPMKASATSNTIRWNDALAAQGYVVQRRVVGDTDWTTLAALSGSDDFYEDMTIKAGLTYEYQVIAENGFGALESLSSTQLFSERSKFINLAARAHIIPDSSNRDWTLLNAGIRLSGNEPTKRMLGLGIGPYNDARFGGWLKDTEMLLERVEVINGAPTGVTIARNDDWMRDYDDHTQLNPSVSALEDVMTQRNTAPLPVDDLNSNFVGMDSALISEIPLGSNIFKVFAKSSTDSAGDVGVQAYDAEYVGGDNPPIRDNRIVNLSSKGYLNPGGVFNGSLIIEGEAPKEVLVLARGPALTVKGVAGAIDDTKLVMKRTHDILLENDDWDQQVGTTNPDRGLLRVETDMTRIRAAITSIGQNPDEHTKDSAMLVTLAPGTEGYIFKIEAGAASVLGGGTVQVQINEIEME